MIQTLCSVVVPVYNSATLLEALHRQLSEALAEHSPLEFLYVDDASTDGSAAVLRGLAAADNRVRVVLFSRNAGQQEATLCGLLLARGEVVANLDSDLQHPPALLPKMIQSLRQGHLDIVYAVPEGGQAGLLRTLGGRLRDAFFRRVFHLPPGLQVSSYRVMTARLAERVVTERSRFNYFSAMVFARPTRASTLWYPFQPRPAGRSSYSALRRVGLYLRILWHYGPLASRKQPPVPFPIKETAELCSDVGEAQARPREAYGQYADKAGAELNPQMGVNQRFPRRTSMPEAPKLLILGGGPCQLHAFALAKARGISTALFDYLPHPPAAALADVHIQVSTFDVTACVEAAGKLPLAGVMTLGTDQPVYTAARIAERYSLPSLLDGSTAFAVTNKEAMKRTFDIYGIPCVPWRVVDWASLARTDWPGPVVLKPLDSQGQRGVLRCEGVEEALQCFHEAISHSRREKLLLEAYYPSDEVTLSAWVSDGKAQLLTATDRLTFPEPMHIGICAAHRYPSRAAADCLPELEALTQAVAEAFALREGPLYIQVLLGKKGPLVNEIACRIGGAFEDVFIPRLTGFDILGAVMDAALGKTVPPPILRPRRGEVRELMLFTRPGTINTLTPIEALRSLPFVLDAGYALDLGDTVPPLEHAGSRLGHAVLWAEDAAEMAANLRSFYEVFSVRDAAGQDLLLRRETE